MKTAQLFLTLAFLALSAACSALGTSTKETPPIPEVKVETGSCSAEQVKSPFDIWAEEEAGLRQENKDRLTVWSSDQVLHIEAKKNYYLCLIDNTHPGAVLAKVQACVEPAAIATEPTLALSYWNNLDIQNTKDPRVQAILLAGAWTRCVEAYRETALKSCRAGDPTGLSRLNEDLLRCGNMPQKPHMEKQTMIPGQSAAKPPAKGPPVR